MWLQRFYLIAGIFNYKIYKNKDPSFIFLNNILTITIMSIINKQTISATSDTKPNKIQSIIPIFPFNSVSDFRLNSQSFRNNKQQNLSLSKNFIDTIEIDYKEKTFELMRKNAELQLSIKQSKLDVDNLEKQIFKLSQLMVELVSTLGICQRQMINFSQNHSSSNRSLLEKLTKILRSESIAKIQAVLQKQQNIQAQQLQSSKMTFINEPVKSHPTSTLNSHQNSQDFVMPERRQQEQMEGFNCDCQEKFGEIISQYKEIIDTQHKNIAKKDKNYKLLKKQVQEYQSIVENLKNNIKQYQKNINDMQQQMQKLKQNKNQQNSILKQYKQQETKYKNKLSQLQKINQQKDKSIEMLETHVQQIFRQKEKIKHKYKKQLVHFEEMEKLVEQKLIQVQYQMSFYKRQRTENFQKISKLQAEVRQYKAMEQKNYYSFGGNYKDQTTQVNQDQLLESLIKVQLITQPVVQTTKQMNQSQQRPISKQQKQIWQIQCYQQSIKTLLKQNDRLKQVLLKLYQINNSQGGNKNIDVQTQIQLKMMVSAMETTKNTHQVNQQDRNQNITRLETESKQHVSQDGRKGRKFIKQA